MPGATDTPPAPEQAPGRRDFLGMVTTAGTVTGIAACAIPFVQSLQPQDSAAAHLPVDVDIAHLAPGQQMVAVWQGKPVFIIRRTPVELESLQNAELSALLKDATFTANQQPCSEEHTSQL